MKKWKKLKKTNKRANESNKSTTNHKTNVFLMIFKFLSFFIFSLFLYVSCFLRFVRGDIFFNRFAFCFCPHYCVLTFSDVCVSFFCIPWDSSLILQIFHNFCWFFVILRLYPCCLYPLVFVPWFLLSKPRVVLGIGRRSSTSKS